MSIQQAGLVSRRHWILFVATILVFQSLTVQATAATLEELERKIEQQKSNQRRANAAKPAGAVNSPRATSETTPTSKLVIEADAACELKINGVRMRTLQANSAESFPVALGQQLLECTSTQVPAIKIKRTWTVNRAGSQEVLSFALRSSIGVFQTIGLLSSGVYNHTDQKDNDWDGDNGSCTSQTVFRREMTTGSPDSTGRVKGSISIRNQESLTGKRTRGCYLSPQEVTVVSFEVYQVDDELRFETQVIDNKCVAVCDEFKQGLVGDRHRGKLEVIDGGKLLKLNYFDSDSTERIYSRR